jgi:ATP-dependent Zn protease
LNSFFHIALSLIILYSLIRGGSGINNSLFGASNKIKQFSVDKNVRVKFKDVAG